MSEGEATMGRMEKGTMVRGWRESGIGKLGEAIGEEWEEARAGGGERSGKLR